MASSFVLHGKGEEDFPPLSKLFPNHGIALKQQQQQQKIHTGLTFSTVLASEKQRSQKVSKVTSDSTLKVVGTKPAPIIVGAWKEQSTASEEQSSALVKKANWGNDPIFDSFGWSEHSSSSGFSSPFGSELGSTETDETESDEGEDFIAELTRQMADYMLKDDEEEAEGEEVVTIDEVVTVDDKDSEENKVPNSTPSIVQTSNPYGLAGNWSNYNSMEICYYNQESLGTYVKPMAESENQVQSSNPVFYSSDDLKRPIHVYHLKDQPTPVKQRASKSKAKRVKGTTTTESAQKLKTEKQSTDSSSTKKQTLGGHVPVLNNGAGIRAIFLGPGSLNGSFGTGVFLPRRNNNNNPTVNQQPKKKSGGSTVLIPARVLQALQQHFIHMEALSSLSNACAVSPTHVPRHEADYEVLVSEENKISEDQTRTASVANDQEMQLPQEWTY